MHMEGDCLTTNLTLIMTSTQIKEDNLTANDTHDIDIEGDCPTTKLTMITTNIETNDTKHNEEMEIEETLTPQNVDLFTITNTTSTPITITLPNISLLYTNDDTLPNLTPIEKETKEELAEVKYVDISDDEQTLWMTV